MMVGKNPVPLFKVGHAFACFDNLSRWFMAQNNRGLFLDVPGHHVSGTDAARMRLYQHITGPDPGDRDIFYPYIIKAVKSRNLHGYGLF
jgi:hypothetical protein